MTLPENIPEYIHAFHVTLCEKASAEFCGGGDSIYDGVTVYSWRHKIEIRSFCNALVERSAGAMSKHIFSKWHEKKTQFDCHDFFMLNDPHNHNVIMCNKGMVSLLVMEEVTNKQFWKDIHKTMKNMSDLIKDMQDRFRDCLIISFKPGEESA